MAALGTAEAPTKAKRRRKAKAKPLPQPFKPQPACVSAAQIADGRLAVAVKLQGANANGEEMVVDEWEWPRIRLAFGDVWGVLVNRGYRYVVAIGRHGGLRLARWIAGAKGGEVVSYRNGDSLDLRRSNLVVVAKEQFVAGGFRHG
jgi:hypothetical protein